MVMGLAFTATVCKLLMEPLFATVRKDGMVQSAMYQVGTFWEALTDHTRSLGIHRCLSTDSIERVWLAASSLSSFFVLLVTLSQDLVKRSVPCLA